jgi:hypothetical protein
MKLLNTILPEAEKKRQWIAVGITIIISGLLTLWGIYGIGEYGFALFVFTPFFIGACPAILFGYKRETTWKQSRQISFLTLAIATFFLLLFAIEGVICIVMAAPFGMLLTFAGSATGYAIISKTPKNGPAAIVILMALIPTTAFIEKDNEPALISVVTSIEIAANAETVWKNVIEFPQLAPPTEFLFKTGIAYPINAKIDGSGVGAVRHCNFTTGSFVEPVTVWNEPGLLKFDVEEQPAPMKELSFWKIDAPHLHDYFISRQGQFKLTALPNGHTLLEGTTWYYHDIKPQFYWQLWSRYIIHKIHLRVLEHIKHTSEKHIALSQDEN